MRSIVDPQYQKRRDPELGLAAFFTAGLATSWMSLAFARSTFNYFLPSTYYPLNISSANVQKASSPPWSATHSEARAIRGACGCNCGIGKWR